MARYIDANVLKEKLLKERDAIPTTRAERYSFGVECPNRDGNAMRGGIRKALRCMEQTPTADVVEVVRCKDCEYFDRDYDDSVIGACSNKRQNIRCNENHFCSYGERRDT